MSSDDKKTSVVAFSPCGCVVAADLDGTKEFIDQYQTRKLRMKWVTQSEAVEMMRASKCNCNTQATAADAIHAWMRGESIYPGDGAVIATMDEYMREHVRNRCLGFDVLASSDLDSAERLIHKLRSHWSL